GEEVRPERLAKEAGAAEAVLACAPVVPQDERGRRAAEVVVDAPGRRARVRDRGTVRAHLLDEQLVAAGGEIERSDAELAREHDRLGPRARREDRRMRLL